MSLSFHRSNYFSVHFWVMQYSVNTTDATGTKNFEKTLLAHTQHTITVVGAEMQRFQDAMGSNQYVVEKMETFS